MVQFNSVICFADITYRLADGASSNEGRLEMSVNNQWGTVCYYGFTDMSARVACRSMGYIDGIQHIMSIPRGSGPVFLSGVSCAGNESAIHNCMHEGIQRYVQSACSDHSRDVAIECFHNGE